MAEKLDVLDQAIAKQLGVHGKQLWIGGTVEPEARALLKRRGWAVFDRQFDYMLRPQEKTQKSRNASS
ncbi:MAG: hypothetical protein EHM86_02730 [Desulfobulbaceae bacterium]|nr:MAG: hypothetical protein EHM86_02730 [Desulfobulbaceae bacterium]